MTGQCFVSCQLDPLSWSSPSLNPTSSSSTAPPPRSLVLVCSVRVSVYALQVPIRKHPSGEPRYGLCQRLYSLKIRWLNMNRLHIFMKVLLIIWLMFLFGFLGGIWRYNRYKLVKRGLLKVVKSPSKSTHIKHQNKFSCYCWNGWCHMMDRFWRVVKMRVMPCHRL